MASTAPAPTLTMILKVTVDPSNVPAFLEALRPVYDGVSSTPECTFVQLLQSPSSPGEFKIVETWNATMEWLQSVQLKKPYYAILAEKVTPLYTKPQEIEVWEGVQGKEWVSVNKDFYFS
ncbi:uncharacterized protein BDZ99DRAFT_466255 [Mytilinidion resinicola]|uniref:ABM domain-containing protein n=1 Tax=Mytilinidion resinicola TaxID=574789 RepID=A0A6A6YBF2_9PEZI|nr:uncharacterized protein BDZ99DRAFT_466255 [Mytilinidion resinicola]KAF2805949.1 hypothetical protein BDZ99DRAFT_466255 [Mytilinidion resinicola]